MPEQKPFTPQQDEIIRELYEKEKITKWAIIARKLTQEHNIPRNAKQCRDRYQQFLDPLIKSNWTFQEEKKLFQLHDEIGNKWALIALQFPGKTDNIVKNYFYSKLRKSMRRLNKIINKKMKKQFKELKIGVIYKIIEGFEEQFKEHPVVDSEVSQTCKALKNELLEYSKDVQSEMIDEDFSKQRLLLKEIFQFNRNYKKKSKKERRNSIQTSQLFKVPERKLRVVSDQEESESDFSFPISHEENIYQHSSQGGDSPRLMVVLEEDSIRESQNSKISFKDIKEQFMFDKISDKVNSVEDLLRESGALERNKFSIPFKEGSSHKSVSNRSQFQKINMFDEVRFSGGLKSIKMEDQLYDDLRFSGGLKGSQNHMMEEEREEREDLYRSHR